MPHWARSSKKFHISLPSGDRRPRQGNATLTPSSPLQLVADDDCHSRSGWLGLALVAVVIGIVSLIAVVVLYCLSGSIPDEYGVVIDAGSSHSGVFLYKWNGRKKNTGIIKQVGSYCDVESGLSSYMYNPEAAGESLVPCLVNISTLVPSQRRPLSALYLAATAGMRLLE
ncbi:hypothetical protein D918_07729 [Trichuris suis]|nr:hypothetical protein D918_07729 [Trichuris suis]